MKLVLWGLAATSALFILGEIKRAATNAEWGPSMLIIQLAIFTGSLLAIRNLP